jgi:RimJ/RimL family protein N-acetyltransferase
MAHRAWFPDRLEGTRTVLRMHTPANLRAFERWYTDPEVARLTRYQEGPMRPAEIERFFAARVVGPDSLALAVHVKSTDRLIGSCAFSQLDGDNGSALYHITIGEKDAWGSGYGTEATRLMLRHAFETLRLHRVALSVFEFNERAIRSYRSCGFTVEGRSREAIWREGRWWDEITMSILEPEWRARQARTPARDGGREGAAEPIATSPVRERVFGRAERRRSGAAEPVAEERRRSVSRGSSAGR